MIEYHFHNCAECGYQWADTDTACPYDEDAWCDECIEYYVPAAPADYVTSYLFR